MDEDILGTAYAQYQRGKELYSNGRQSAAPDAPVRPATDGERMAGAALMRSAIVRLIKGGNSLPADVASHFAFCLLSLNDDQAIGPFVPYVAADVRCVIDIASADACRVRNEIVASLRQSASVPVSYIAPLLESLDRADRGRLAGLAAPGKETVVDVIQESEKPLTATERNTLLTIIAAFCKYEGIDPQARGVAKEIEQMTLDLGARVSDDTIRTVLGKIPDALASRMK